MRLPSAWQHCIPVCDIDALAVERLGETVNLFINV